MQMSEKKYSQDFYRINQQPIGAALLNLIFLIFIIDYLFE